MKTLLAIGLFTAGFTPAATIDISTGVAAWQVSGPGLTGTAIALAAGQQNGTWAPAPAGSSWLSWGAAQGTSCVIGQIPGNGCASTLFNAGGDNWIYSLTVSAASLGATSGNLNFLFGGDDAVDLLIGNAVAIEQQWNQGAGLGAFAQLACSANGGPTNAGNSQATYNTCTTELSFNASELNGDGSLTFTAAVFNAPVTNCTTCGDPTGFVLEGDILTGAAASTPEPGTFGLIGAAGLALFAMRRACLRA